MSPKNETTILIFTLLITVSILGGCLWLVTHWNKKQSQESQPIPQNLAMVENVPSGLFNYGGSTTFAPIRQEVDRVIQTVWPNFHLRYTDPISGTPGSRKGIEMLLKNQLAFSQSSRAIKNDEYEAAKPGGFILKEIPVAIDGIAIAVHPDLNIPGITLAQLKDIYLGKITNWREVGGADLPIIPYSRDPKDGGTVEFFIDNILGGEELGKNVELVYSTTPGLRKVAENLGGIYYASAPEVVPQCTVKTLPIGKTTEQFIPPYQEPFIPQSQCPNQRNQISQAAFQSGAYPITRRLFVIIKENGQDDEQAGLAYANLLLTEQGQDLIEKAGFVRLR
ncbi:MAG: substrate-binding domain-containing protein [Gomphosphaeria aponina SAG 52.96 = DSM 107014]|uniref:Substrate-binding domain-containing protein n=1 Tax=Gomphosphaeria aponina SAG 52.96 = DSM 107014 TaxID=1521640 RepID=A0A941GWC3_9CHRO|nr:substrate-binding domain-containing protein [Gomphosphaeria aponina SAG 52.96 = DSM 107014]